jgi:Fibronectin type III domain
LRYLRFVPVCVLALAVLAGCGDDSSSTGGLTGSSTSSSTTSPPSTGSGPTAPSAGSATLKWAEPTSNTNGTPLTNLAGYRILYGENSANLSESVDVNTPASTQLVINNLAAGTWYFAIKAVTSAGVESPLSDVVSATIS